MEPLAHLPTSTPGVDDLVEALMVSAGHLNLLMSRMSLAAEFDDRADAEPVPILLRRLLRGTLAPLADSFALADIQTATRVVNRATVTAERDLFMVAPDLGEEEEEDENEH
jgi:hypothetical protein